MKKTIRNALDDGIKLLRDNKVIDAQIDANMLLEQILQMDKVNIIINGNKEITEHKYISYMRLINIRAKGKPLQYITGYQEFMGLPFKVNNNVLIPRQDTEILVLEAIKCIKENNITNILEIGSGSGCIPISICNECENVRATSVDISIEAISVAKQNAVTNKVDDRISFIQSNLFEKVDNINNFELFISNPPYIKRNEIVSLMREVKDYEPIGALDGGEDGLYFYKQISKKVKELTNEKSYIFYEVGHDQSEEVKEILEYYGYTNINISKDLAGINRVVSGTMYK
ncbi:MAG: peptide chain release factor N(5)-glutamine methyltransferase [Vallitalea sp.]|jgi:release factor glutamine methyltransferase|nr:peptide chain release factor N(5)-glutamine methyltransferase [Vallitalea sp.]